MRLDLSQSEKWMVPTIIAVSVIVPVLILILMYLPNRENYYELQSGTLPLFHAVINGMTAVLLLLGYFLMKVGQYTLHRNVMITAFFLSTLFLLSYVFSKVNIDPVSYGGEGAIRYLYFFILIRHIVLSAVIVPLVLFTIFRGLKGEFKKHAKIAKWTFPIWLYVTISGVFAGLYLQFSA